jgi:hypothetical protein
VQVARVSGIVYEFGHIDVTLAHCNDNGILESHDIKSISPIPLTDEILDKNLDRKEHGWQVKDCWKIWANPNYGYILATLVMDAFGGGSYEPCIPCTYLHELQNAMTVLRAGKEIKP